MTPLMGKSSAPTHLMRQVGPYRGADGNGRHWMQIDPDLPAPALRDVLWWLVWIGCFITLVAIVHAHPGP